MWTHRVKLSGQKDYEREGRLFVVCCLILWEQKMVSVAPYREKKQLKVIYMGSKPVNLSVQVKILKVRGKRQLIYGSELDFNH